jgi:hypothetical protein
MRRVRLVAFGEALALGDSLGAQAGAGDLDDSAVIATVTSDGRQRS